MEPNADGLSVSVSFVWLSNEGLTIWQLTKIHSCCRTWFALTAVPFLPFDTCSRMRATICCSTCSTCLPPLIVAMLFTNDTCRAVPSDTAKPTSHTRPLFSLWSNTTVGFGFAASSLLGLPLISWIACTYISTYCLKFLILSRSPFRNTLTPLTVPAMSYTRFISSASVSASMPSMWKSARSGLKVMHVYSSLRVFLVIFGSDFSCMCCEKTCLYLSSRSRSAVSTMNSVE